MPIFLFRKDDGNEEAMFLWQEEDCAPRPDSLMTRCRAARLLRAWRNAKLQGRRQFDLAVDRGQTGYRVYRVRHTHFDARGALWVPLGTAQAGKEL